MAKSKFDQRLFQQNKRDRWSEDWENEKAERRAYWEQNLGNPELRTIEEKGWGLHNLHTAGPDQMEKPPYTLFALPDAKVVATPYLNGTGTGGYVVDQGWGNSGGGKREAMFVKMFEPTRKGQGFRVKPHTVAHEAEHLMARRAFGFSSSINGRWDEILNDKYDRYDNPSPQTRAQFTEQMGGLMDYMEEKYGSTSGYFSPRYIAKHEPGALLYEQLAEMAAIEVVQGVDLTKDPVLSQTVFKDKKIREAYRALTGLRQSRLDAKDLRPHTAYDEKTGRNLEYDAAVKADQEANNTFLSRMLQKVGFSPVDTASRLKGRYERYDDTIDDTTR